VNNYNGINVEQYRAGVNKINYVTGSKLKQNGDKTSMN